MQSDLRQPCDKTQNLELLLAEITAACSDREAEAILQDEFGRGLRFYFTHCLGTDDVTELVETTLQAVAVTVRSDRSLQARELPGLVRAIALRRISSGQVGLRPCGGPTAAAASSTAALSKARARKLVRALPFLDREILRRFYCEGQAEERICAELGLTESEFAQHKQRIKDFILCRAP